jgi:hypothetical protein
MVAFLAFFFLLLFVTDIFLPYKQSFEIEEFKASKFKSDEEQLLEQDKSKTLILVDRTLIFGQKMKVSRYENNIIKTYNSPSPFYMIGGIFVIFLAIGSFYGLFFKKPMYLERRAFYYNIAVCSILFLMMLIFS